MATGSNRVHGGELTAFVERIERLTEDRKEVSDGIAAVYAEAKAGGYAPAYIRAVIKLRALAPSQREENAAMLEMYMAAVGMATETPLFRHVQGMGADAAVRERLIEALQLLAPEDGEITIKTAGAPRLRLWRDKAGTHVEEVPDAPAPPQPKTTPARPHRAAQKPPPPEVDAAGAHALGHAARKADASVTANPFPWDDPRRREWDAGWREADGGDGMGPA